MLPSIVRDGRRPALPAVQARRAWCVRRTSEPFDALSRWRAPRQCVVQGLSAQKDRQLGALVELMQQCWDQACCLHRWRSVSCRPIGYASPRPRAQAPRARPTFAQLVYRLTTLQKGMTGAGASAAAVLRGGAQSGPPSAMMRVTSSSSANRA